VTAPTPPLPPRLLDINATAAYLGLSIWTIRCYMQDGFLKPVRLPSVRQNTDGGRRRGENGRRLLFDRVDLDAFIESRRGA
jgi:hypothetical protein